MNLTEVLTDALPTAKGGKIGDVSSDACPSLHCCEVANGESVYEQGNKPTACGVDSGSTRSAPIALLVLAQEKNWGTKYGIGVTPR